MKDDSILILRAGELRQFIREEVKAATHNEVKDKEEMFKERMSRREAARFLGIQYATVWHWVKKGILTEHGTGRKKYFLKHELIAAMEEKRD